MRLFTNPTPAQRALIQLVESLLISALVAGIAAITPMLAGSGAIDWQQTANIFFLAVIFSIAHGVVAYFKTSNADLANALETIIDLLEKRMSSVAQEQKASRGTIELPVIKTQPMPGQDQQKGTL